HLLYDHRWWIVFGAFALFFSSLSLNSALKRELVPATDQSVFIANLKLPVNYSILHTDAITQQCEALLRQRGEIKNLYVAVGGFGGNAANTALMFITLKPYSERPAADRSEKFQPEGPWLTQKIAQFFRLFQTPRLTQAE